MTGPLALTVYSPDALRSGLAHELDAAVVAATGAAPVARRLVGHGPASIERFYARSVGRNVPRWHLVVELFTAGPSLATLWRGEGAQAGLAAVKGPTFPSAAPASTIRGRFCCDNPVTNLVHVSDPGEVEAEAGLLGLDVAGVGPAPLPLCPRPAQGPRLAHSGIYALVESLHLQLALSGPQPPPPVPVVRMGEPAADSFSRLRSYLGELGTLASGGSPAADAVSAYLDGDGPACVAALSVGAALWPWDAFLIRCGSVDVHGWPDRST